MDDIKQMPRIYAASGKDRGNMTGTTPLQAVRAFLARHPTARKISVYEVSLNSEGCITFPLTDRTYQKWPDLTKAAALALPDVPSAYKPPIANGSELAPALNAVPIGTEVEVPAALYESFLGALPPVEMGPNWFTFVEGADRIRHFRMDRQSQRAFCKFTEAFSHG